MIRYFFYYFGLILFSAVLYGCVGNAASSNVTTYRAPEPQLEPWLQTFISDFDRFFSTALDVTQAPGAAIVIVKGDTVIFEKGYGLRVAGTTDSVDTHTLFRIGSLSKGFAGVLTGILVQRGLLHWDDRVKQYYPDFTLRDREQAGRVRLWHLLSHTTGLPYHAFTNLIERGFDTPRIVKEYFPQAPVSGREGEFFSYQNAAFCVIEEVMKSRTGEPYAQLLAENIFQPAGMSTASCDLAGMTGCSNKTLPHFWTGANWRHEPISPLYYNAAAAGGVNASISDMGEWLKLLMGHKPNIVADSTLDQVFKPVVKTGKERRIFPRWLDRDDASYAMGWRVLEHQGDTIMYHGGYVNGFRGEIAFNRRDDIGVCILFNASCDLVGTCVPEFFERWKSALKNR